MVYIICIFIGIVTAFIGSIIGLGGGAILIPVMLLLYSYSSEFAWATPQAMVGISLIAMVFTALSSTIAYYKAGRVDYRTGLLFLGGSIPGSVMGSWLNQFIDVDRFTLYFGCLMIFISLLFFMRRKERPLKQSTSQSESLRTFHIEGKTYHYSVNIWIASLISLVVGMLSGLFGIGGGSIMVPAMILLFGFPAHIATATSMFMIFFVSIIGASTHIVLGHIAWEYVFFFIPGAWIGGKLGAYTNQLMHGKTLVWILRIIIMVIGMRLITDSVL